MTIPTMVSLMDKTNHGYTLKGKINHGCYQGQNQPWLLSMTKPTMVTLNEKTTMVTLNDKTNHGYSQ